MEKTHSHIEHVIAGKQPGDLVFPSDFRGSGSQDAIKKALSRLARQGRVKRLAQGIYYLPKTDPVLGELRPAAEEVARMIAQKEHIRIRPTGIAALHELGLSTQMPTRLVYLTDGHPRQFRVGKLPVKFKATTPKKLAMKGPISSLLLLALEEIGIEQIDRVTEKKICDLIIKEDPELLQHDLRLGSTKANDYIVHLLETKSK